MNRELIPLNRETTGFNRELTLQLHRRQNLEPVVNASRENLTLGTQQSKHWTFGLGEFLPVRFRAPRPETRHSARAIRRAEGNRGAYGVPRVTRRPLDDRLDAPHGWR